MKLIELKEWSVSDDTMGEETETLVFLAQNGERKLRVRYSASSKRSYFNKADFDALATADRNVFISRYPQRFYESTAKPNPSKRGRVEKSSSPAPSK